MIYTSTAERFSTTEGSKPEVHGQEDDIVEAINSAMPYSPERFTLVHLTSR